MLFSRARGTRTPEIAWVSAWVSWWFPLSTGSNMGELALTLRGGGTFGQPRDVQDCPPHSTVDSFRATGGGIWAWLLSRLQGLLRRMAPCCRKHPHFPTGRFQTCKPLSVTALPFILLQHARCILHSVMGRGVRLPHCRGWFAADAVARCAYESSATFFLGSQKGFRNEPRGPLKGNRGRFSSAKNQRTMGGYIVLKRMSTTRVIHPVKLRMRCAKTMSTSSGMCTVRRATVLVKECGSLLRQVKKPAQSSSYANSAGSYL